MEVKKYAIVMDVSPSEQISPNPKEVKILAVVIGLYQHDSFEKVGRDAEDDSNRLALKKWSGASKKYKKNFLIHADKLRNDGKVIFGAETINDEMISDIGNCVIKFYFGMLPEPSSLNKKGLPRIMISEINLFGKEFPKTEILVNDLKVIAWYAYSIAALYNMLSNINADYTVKLDVLVDNLPNERGGYYKARILRKFVERMTKNLATVVGVPAKGDAVQRDIFVDNLAGLGRELELQRCKWMDADEKKLAKSLYAITSNHIIGLATPDNVMSISEEE